MCMCSLLDDMSFDSFFFFSSLSFPHACLRLLSMLVKTFFSLLPVSVRLTFCFLCVLQMFAWLFSPCRGLLRMLVWPFSLCVSFLACCNREFGWGGGGVPYLSACMSSIVVGFHLSPWFVSFFKGPRVWMMHRVIRRMIHHVHKTFFVQ